VQHLKVLRACLLLLYTMVCFRTLSPLSLPARVAVSARVVFSKYERRSEKVGGGVDSIAAG